MQFKTDLIKFIIRDSINENQKIPEQMGLSYHEPITLKLSRRSGHSTALADLVRELDTEAIVVTNTLDQAHHLVANHGLQNVFSVNQDPPRGKKLPKLVFIDNAFYCDQRRIIEWMRAFPGCQFILLG
jgi:dihydroorotate dehydrogenase